MYLWIFPFLARVNNGEAAELIFVCSNENVILFCDLV